jgi:hypothetical protein
VEWGTTSPTPHTRILDMADRKGHTMRRKFFKSYGDPLRLLNSRRRKIITLMQNMSYYELRRAISFGIEKQIKENRYLDRTHYKTVEELILDRGSSTIVYPGTHRYARHHTFDLEVGECFNSCLRICSTNSRFQYVEGMVYTKKKHNGGYSYVRHSWLYDTHMRVHIDPYIKDELIPDRRIGFIVSNGKLSYLLDLWYDDPEKTQRQHLHDRCSHYTQYNNDDRGWSPLTYLLVTDYWR